MPDKGTHRAVLDRIEDGHAVLLVGEDELELICDAELVPDGVSGGDHVHVRLSDGVVESVTRDPDATDAASSRISDKMRALRARKRT